MRKRIHLLLLCFLAPMLTGAASADTPFFFPGVTAHRGNSAHFPENTLPAFASAIELGTDWAELDIHRTKDGKLVVCHDADTRRTGDKTLVIAHSTYSELLAVDIAAGFRREHGKNLTECPPHSLPLLEDVLALFKKQKKTRISIQPKTDCIEQAIRLIRSAGVEKIVGFNDGNLAYMSQVKEMAPGIPVFWDRPADSDMDEDIRIATEKGFESLVINCKGITPEKIKKIREAGLVPGAWTVNDRETMKKLLDSGIEKIYTDDPALLIKVREESQKIVCEGNYPMHLQGICTNSAGFIYWSWTNELVKTDMQGKMQKRIKVLSHHGDLCYHNGKIFVAVNLGKFNEPPGKADSWIFEYDASSLRELKRYRVPELVHGAGGIGFHNGKFIVVGGLVKGTPENYLYEYDQNFRFCKRHILASGTTEKGIQTITWAGGYWWCGCYGQPEVLLRTDEQFRFTDKSIFSASLGIVPLSDGRLLIGRNRSDKIAGHQGWAVIYYTLNH